MAGYTKEQIVERAELASSDMGAFYKAKFVNYRGKATDTGERYTEAVAGWLLDNLSLFEGIRTVTRGASYCVAGHDRTTAGTPSNREEEHVAMDIWRQGSLGALGDVLDYQVPLKNTAREENKGLGKIDLLAYDGENLTILELKRAASKETMLRCVLEGYTYLRTVDTAKLAADFAKLGVRPDAKVRACPLVYRGGAQWAEMREDRPHLKELMEKLGSKPYYLVETDGRFTVSEG